ncbi:MAG TPA: flagellar biosynthetic protein FliR [Chloroflexota bacterium]|nr:flagellar biosynthetic protein FliR [Chloroflexota bacterium]
MALSLAVGRWDIFLLVLVRVASMIMVAPVFGARPVPAQVKIGLAVLLTLILVPLQPASAPLMGDWLTTFLAVAKEAIVGFLLGYVATLLFSAVQMAAQVVGVQVGYAFSSTMDPLLMQNSSFLDSFYNYLAVLVFLGLGGHHALISAVSNSFELVPLGQFGGEAIIGNRLVALSSATFGIALKLALPVVGTMLLVDAAFALVVRSVPQMNIFAVGLPVKMVVGVLAMAALIPVTVASFGTVTNNVAGAVAGLLR